MGIQREMIGHESHSLLHQGSDPPALNPGQGRWLAFPEVAVVHQQQVRPPFHRRVDQSLTGGHSGDQPSDPLNSCIDLQAIGTVILKRRGIQQLVTIVCQFSKLDHCQFLIFVETGDFATMLGYSVDWICRTAGKNA